jgi:hypothetical protein
MTNLQKIRIELRDQQSKIFSDEELESFLTDNGLNKNDVYTMSMKQKIMLSVKDALRSLLRDWDAAQTKISGDLQEGYSKSGVVSEIERIEKENDSNFCVGEIGYGN